MAERTVEDLLREEYFVLLPEMAAVRQELEAEVRYSLLPLTTKLSRYEQIVVSSRVKDCESALQALRRRQEGGTFDPDRADPYTLTTLRDLAGVRVLAFPSARRLEADDRVRQRFPSWDSDPILDGATGELVASKYDGYCNASARVRGELQIVPMLIGLFWQVEHSTMYKPSPELKGVSQSLEMRQRGSDVLQALGAFEQEFERLLLRDPFNKP